MLSTDKIPKQVAEITAYSQTWIDQLINRYNQEGEKRLGDLRAALDANASAPAERLWPLTNEVIANHTPRSLCELEELLVVRC